jgi:hypothetical protein
MKKILMVLLLGSIFYGAYSQKTLRAGIIAFYNLENLFDTINTEGVLDEEFTPDGPNEWTGKRYLDKIERMAGVISRIGEDERIPGGPAILGVSEIENRSVLEDLVAHPYLQNAEYRIVHYDSPDLRGVDVALLYQPRYFTLESSASLELPIFDEDGERIYTRDQLLVSGKFIDEDIHFIVNHWPSRRGGEKASSSRRNAAAALSRSIVDSLTAIDSKAKIVVMGDFNDDPVNSSMKDILKAKDHIDNLADGEMFNCMYSLYKKGVGSLAYRDNWNLFDQIVVSKGLLEDNYSTLSYYAARVFNKDFLMQQDGRYKGYPFRTYVGATHQGGFSDHFPVYIVVVKEME